jgi:aminoacyl-tRNA hydrolase
MYPVSSPAGITFIRDDAKAPLWSIPHALQFMNDATARRKIVIFGTISDYSGNSDRKYVSVAKEALNVADYVIFVGPSASKSAKAKRHARGEALQSFYSVDAAREYLQDLLKPGDLVLLKGGSRDELGSVISLHAGNERGDAEDTERDRTTGAKPTGDHDTKRLDATALEQPIRALVGLGNGGERFQHSPHNIGQRVLDRIASSMGAEWTQTDDAIIACVEWQGEVLYLMKPVTMMNDTGPVLLQLSNRLKFKPAECVLIQDDIDLALGAVRVHTRAGDGGHRGVRSVFEAFRTDRIRRVRVGVGRPEHKDRLRDYVLESFPASDAPVVEKVCTQAADRVLAMIASKGSSCRVSSHRWRGRNDDTATIEEQ